MDISPTTIGRLVIAAGAAVGWMMAGTPTQDAANSRESQSSVARPQPEAVVPPARFTEVLHERMRQPAIPESGRNPFTYGSRPASPHNTASVSAPPTATAPEIVEPPPPAFKLSGIAASQQDGGVVLTAIVIDNGVMVFAKTGDKLSNGYSVVRVDDVSITIVDAAGVTQTLRLP